jgi:multicomponent Na+:H+ antiporter subunit G
MRELLISLFLWSGSGFVLLAAVGLLRFPDVFTRMHAVAKAGTLGITGLAIAVGIYFAELGVLFQAMLIILFLLLTAPVATHMIGRAAYWAGVPLWENTICDELGDALRAKGADKDGKESAGKT